jgi:hypothetical protein
VQGQDIFLKEERDCRDPGNLSLAQRREDQDWQQQDNKKERNPMGSPFHVEPPGLAVN